MEFDTGRCGDDIGGDGPWTEVQYNKNRKNRGNGVEMTFFVQNLPDRTTKSILWQAFQPHGFVSDAYVARKKDKRGNNFGFVRFMGVDNLDLTVAAMNTVKIFEAKVSVSLAKFDKNHKKFIYTSKVIGERVWKPKETSNSIPLNNYGASSGGAPIREGVSFANLFRNGNNCNNLGSKTIEVDGRGVKYPVHCMGRSIHGVAKDLSSLKNLYQDLNSEGLNEFGLSYIGGLSVLLTLGNPDMVKEAMTKHVDCFSRIFSRFQVWKGEDLPVERVANLRITGVPVHLRDNTLYDRIGGLFGAVVQGSSFSWSDSVNANSSVLALVPHGKCIEESVVIKWKERRYVIWVSEDAAIWEPKLDGESPIDNMSESSEEDSEGYSDNSDNESKMEDDVEDGEIRSVNRFEDVRNDDEALPETDRPAAEEDEWPEYDRPVENESPEKPPETEKVANQQTDFDTAAWGNEVHGEGEQFPNSNYDGRECLSGTCHLSGGGEQVGSLDGSGLNSNTPGPNSTFSLGKRNRDQRSPPSLGLTQGPQARVRQDEDNGSLDLNRSLADQVSGAAINPDSATSPVTSARDQRQCSHQVVDSAIDEKQIADEVADTVAIGDIVGVNLQGFESVIRKTIIGEGAQNVYQ
ncbi:putative RNA recognition motif domain, nucleotide-binding alpha-beta plait domain superfamily [Helianthus annuus]|nr:putative RNA recognition motif domain, nucleotide-binding alpha-beta plait domain superfamily [Helianthus annuus]